METSTILVIVSAVLGLLSMLLGNRWVVVKKKLSQLKDVAKEGYEAIETTVNAAADNTVSDEEWAAIKKESMEAWSAIKLLLGIKKDA